MEEDILLEVKGLLQEYRTLEEQEEKIDLFSADPNEADTARKLVLQKKEVEKMICSHLTENEPVSIGKTTLYKKIHPDGSEELLIEE